MIKAIGLKKQLERPGGTIGSQNLTATTNLLEVVNDLISTPFSREKLRLHNSERDGYYSYIDVLYGTGNTRNKSGVPKQEEIIKRETEINSLRSLKRQIKKSLRVDHPDFRIRYRHVKFYEAKTSLDQLVGPTSYTTPTGRFGRIERINFKDRDSSTAVYIRFTRSGLALIQINYDLESYTREIRRVEKAVAKLSERGYGEDTSVI